MRNIFGDGCPQLSPPPYPPNSEYLLEKKKPNIRYSDIWLFYCGATSSIIFNFTYFCLICNFTNYLIFNYS